MLVTGTCSCFPPCQRQIPFFGSLSWKLLSPNASNLRSLLLLVKSIALLKDLKLRVVGKYFLKQRKQKQKMSLNKDRRSNIEIDSFSILWINAIRVRLGLEALVNRVFRNLQANKGPQNKHGHTFCQSQNSADKFRKSSLKKHICEMISKCDQRFLRKITFKNFLMYV